MLVDDSPGAKPVQREIADFEGLVELFRDLPPEPTRCRFAGTVFEVANNGDELVVAAAMLGGLLVGALVARMRERPRGNVARIFFPRPAALDLLVRPLDEQSAPDFASSYCVEALVPHLAERFLSESLRECLVDLWPSHYAEIRDPFVFVGPLDGPPDESAEVIRDLIDGVLQCGAQPPKRLDNDDAELDSFCFYCGQSVSSAAPRCPHCDGDLSDE
jgi:hypothetical protein